MVRTVAYLNVQPSGDELQELAPLETQTVRRRDINQFLPSLAIEAGQDIRRSWSVIVYLAILELIEQFRGKTFGQARLCPVNTVIPVARSEGRVLFEDGAGDVFLLLSALQGTGNILGYILA